MNSGLTSTFALQEQSSDDTDSIESDEEESSDSDDERTPFFYFRKQQAPVKLPKVSPEQVGESFVERAKYIPVRLSLGERKVLRLLEAALNVSGYTDKVDTLSVRGKVAIILRSSFPPWYKH